MKPSRVRKGPAEEAGRTGGGRGDRGGEANRVGRRAVTPSPVSLRPTAPGTGCLGKSADFPLSEPEPRSRNEPRELALFSRLVPSASSADHQMTPALFVPLFRACALSRHSLADWLFALPPVALIPCASRRAGLQKGTLSVEKNAACLAKER